MEISLKAEELFKIAGFEVTNSLTLSFLAFFLLIALAIILNKKIKIIPGYFQSFFELAFEKLLGLMGSVLGSREKSEKYFPLVATIFIFILCSNMLGIFPGVGSLMIHKNGAEVPFFRSPASDLNFTLALAIISVILTNLLGIIAVGFFRHMGKFFNFKNPIKFFIGILEFISEISKIISLSFRLFGNILAGEVLLTIVFFLVPYFAPLPFLFLEIFVGFIQAFVFAMLTLVFIAIHTATEEC